jgi:hypothetical protein
MSETQVIGSTYEQTTYPEWAFSSYRTGDSLDGPLPFGRGSHAQSCQGCHMPKMDPTGAPFRSKIASIQEHNNFPQVENGLSSSEIDLPTRDRFAKHTFVGLNVFLAEMAKQYGGLLGININDRGVPINAMIGELGVPPFDLTGTLRQYGQHVKLHIVHRIGRVKLAKLTRAQVEQFRKSLLDELSLALARKVLTSLKSILKQAGYLHVAIGVGIKRSKRGHRLEPGNDFPEPSEVTAPPRQKALVLMAALTGLRASELRGLRWKDVDLKANELHVRKRADRTNSIGEPKSKSSVRGIPLAPELITALK